MDRFSEHGNSAKEQRQLERRARNMARYAVRMARRGQIGVELEPKTMPRFSPFVDISVDPEVYQLANAQLVNNGLRVERRINQYFKTVSDNPRMFAIGPVMGVDHSQGPHHQVLTDEREFMIVHEVAELPSSPGAVSN